MTRLTYEVSLSFTWLGPNYLNLEIYLSTLLQNWVCTSNLVQLCKARSIFVSSLELLFFSLPILLRLPDCFLVFIMYPCGLPFCFSFVNLLINELTLFKCVAVYSSDYKSLVSQAALFSCNGEYSMHTLKFYSFIILMPSPVPRSNAAFEKWKSQCTLTFTSS